MLGAYDDGWEGEGCVCSASFATDLISTPARRAIFTDHTSYKWASPSPLVSMCVCVCEGVIHHRSDRRGDTDKNKEQHSRCTLAPFSFLLLLPLFSFPCSFLFTLSFLCLCTFTLFYFSSFFIVCHSFAFLSLYITLSFIHHTSLSLLLYTTSTAYTQLVPPQEQYFFYLFLSAILLAPHPKALVLHSGQGKNNSLERQ